MAFFPTNYVSPNNVFPELGKFILADGFDLVLDLEKSQDNKLVDARTGKTYVDYFTGFASMPIGFNHPKMMNDEFIKYIGKIALNKPANSDIYTDAMASFVKTLFEYAVPDYFKYAFFIDGGALAVENALKTAFDWKVRKNMAKGVEGDKGGKIIHFKQAFHGRSGYTMSLTNTDPTKVKLFPKFDWPRITNPKLTFPLTEENINNTIELEKIAVKEIEQAFLDNPNDIAAIIIEPIQGEGGDNHFRNEFLQELRRLADENEALLIFDEVQSGVGLTGTWWAHQQMQVKPDIMAFGKKMQICGILVTDRIDDVPDNVFKESSRINSTWGGNLVDMVRSTFYLQIIHEENLVENAKNMGLKLHEKMLGLEQERPELINNVRGKGLFRAFDFKDVNKRSEFVKNCYEQGLVILSCGDRSVRFRPALNFNEIHLEEGFEIISKVMKNL